MYVGLNIGIQPEKMIYGYFLANPVGLLVLIVYIYRMCDQQELTAIVQLLNFFVVNSVHLDDTTVGGIQVQFVFFLPNV